MASYFMFGKYSIDTLARISAIRTKDANAIIGDCGGILKAAYALFGETDLVLIVEFPSIEKAMKASVSLAKRLGIAFKTVPAFSVEEFDKLIAGR
jgi:uncharacterized protein with GYD domain